MVKENLNCSRIQISEKKHYGASDIFKLIYQNDCITKPIIANMLKISLPTVTNYVQDLIDAGLIEEIGTLESTGGRKPVGLACKKDAYCAIGIDITSHHIGAAVVNFDGSVANSMRRKIPFSNTASYTHIVESFIQELIQTTRIGEQTVLENRILGVGISVPGIVSSGRQKIVYSAVLKIAEFDIRHFVKSLPYKAFFINDAKAAAIGEIWYLRRTGMRNLLYIYLSNSVSAAAVLDLKLVSGKNQNSLDIAHMPLIYGGRKCSCGKQGCIEAYCSASNLSCHTDGDLKQFFVELEKGNAEIAKVWNDYLNYSAILISNMHMIFDQDIIIGGYIGAYIEKYLDKLRMKIQNNESFGNPFNYLHSCHYRNEAAAVGAALINISSFIDSIDSHISATK